MALLKLAKNSRATTSSGKEFQVDPILRANDLRLYSEEKHSGTILKRWPRVIPI